MVESHTYTPIWESLLGMVKHLIPYGIEGLADYYNNDNCVTYLAHLPVLLPIVSTLTLREDNDHRVQQNCQERRGFFGGGVLDDHNPGVTDNSPNNSIGWPEWGTQRCCRGAWSGPLACVPPKVPHPDTVIHMPLS
jgi:hypothetical protein